MIRPVNNVLLASLKGPDVNNSLPFKTLYWEAFESLRRTPPETIPDANKAAAIRLEAGKPWNQFERVVFEGLLDVMRSVVTPELVSTVDLLAGAFAREWILPIKGRVHYREPEGRVSMVQGRLQLPEGKIFLDRDFLVCCPELIVHRLIAFGIAASRLRKVEPWGGASPYWDDDSPSDTRSAVSMALRAFNPLWGAKLMQLGFESVDIGSAMPDFGVLVGLGCEA